MGPYIVMEYLDGESVGAALARVGRFDIDAAVGTAIPVLEALDAAHRAGIIHRDLKPENVFIAFDAGARRGRRSACSTSASPRCSTPAAGPRPRTRTGRRLRHARLSLARAGHGRDAARRPQRSLRGRRAALRAAHGHAALPRAHRRRDGVPGRARRGADARVGGRDTSIPRLEAIVQRLLQKDPGEALPHRGRGRPRARARRARSAAPRRGARPAHQRHAADRPG